jgi:mRNA degradation ribonuclease J1/J2
MSEIHYPKYLSFQQSLEEIQNMIAEFNPQSELNQTALLAALSQVQELFKQEILPINLDELPEERISLFQSYRTEMHKQMSLLTTDVMFFQTARQSTTKQQRLTQIMNRLGSLIRYCDVLLE